MPRQVADDASSAEGVSDDLSVEVDAGTEDVVVEAVAVAVERDASGPGFGAVAEEDQTARGM
jgi:hypothetical protein